MQQLRRTIRLFFATAARAISRESRRTPEAESPPPATFGRPDLELARRDFGVVVFALVALAALLASVPYTFLKVQGLHSADTIGLVQSVGSLFVFEAGAFLAKVATLFIPQWRGRLNLTQAGLLLIVTAANYDVAGVGAATATPAELFIFVALMPFLQWLFLGLAVARADALHQQRVAAQAALSPAEQAQASLAAMQDRVWGAFVDRSLALMEEQTRALGAFPAPLTSARDGFLTPSWTCHTCGTEASQQQRASYARADRAGHSWRCKACEALNERPTE